jgi:alkanesulfonate monooxygenase SsuD/methylene tetrahydromethanopterin reductase-like flavin-dependent oxidoreductase (luciferase family)
VPIWVGGSIRRSAARAARLGDGWYGGVTFRLSQLPRQVQAYRAAAGGDAGAVLLNRLTLVAETRSQLDELAQRHTVGALQGFARPGESLEQAAADMALIGTPEQIITLLERYEAAGASHVFARLSLDETPPEVARRSIELLGREVIPHFAA